MSTDSALRPLQHLLPPAQSPPPIGNGRAAAARAGGRPAFAVRLPAAAQLLLAKTSQSLAINGARPHRLLFVATACLFAAIVPTDIAFGLEMWVSKTIAGIPQHYILTTLTMLLAFGSDGKYLKQLLGRPIVVFYLSCLMLVVAVGVFRNGSNGFVIRADLYLIRWFFVGFMLMRMAIISGRLSEYLVLSAVVILVTVLRISDRNTMGGQIDSSVMRVGSSDFWPVINLGTIMFGLLVTVNWPRGIFHVAFCVSTFSLLVLLGGIKSSTRSLFIAQTLCFLLCLLALSRDPRMRGRGREIRNCIVVLILVAAALLAGLIVTGKILGNVTQLGTRFAEEVSERNDTGAYRLKEAYEMLEMMTPEEWIFGTGVGGMWFSTYCKDWTGLPHIAVLGWLFKGGFFILLVVLWALYIRPFAAFLKSVVAPRRDIPLPPAILIVGPPLLAWATLTFISGGIDIGTFFGLGGLSALWLQLADDERHFLAARTKPLANAPC
jgi:hypothetical protein